MVEQTPETQETRDVRLTVLVSQNEESDVRLVASFHALKISDLVREWAMRDIRTEGASIRRAVVEKQAELAGQDAAA